MLKTTTIAACVLALSGSVALAQAGAQYDSSGGVLPPGGTYNAPYGANGAAPVRDVGSPTANATDTAAGGTQSSTMLEQRIKNQSAAGMPQSYGQGPMAAPRAASPSSQYGYGTQQAFSTADDQMQDPRRVCITDEYGYRYNCRGDRIGGRR
jgi:hypothetical protein